MPKYSITNNKNKYLKCNPVSLQGLASLKVRCIFLLAVMDFGQVIYFGWWNIYRYKGSRGCLFEPCLHSRACFFISAIAVKEIYQGCLMGPWRMRDTRNRLSPRRALLLSVNHSGLWVIINYCYFKSLSLEIYFYTNTELGTEMLKCLVESLPASSCMEYSDCNLRTCPLGYDGSQADIEIMSLMLFSGL